uniref:EF-hand domain-containing protein n=1 Tax=Ascaris lumbricoides TaxID=6252 RepID=A0A0M3HV08_ASCLU
MGNSSSLMLQEDEILAIARETGFKSSACKVDVSGRGYLERDDFLRIPELAINPLGDRIVDAFFTETDDPEQKINFREFIRVLAHFRPPSKGKENSLNSRDEKLKFAFTMYDLNKNGYITRDEFKVILNMMVGANITPEQLDSIADRTITEADLDNDGKISFDEFCRVSCFVFNLASSKSMSKCIEHYTGAHLDCPYHRSTSGNGENRHRTENVDQISELIG